LIESAPPRKSSSSFRRLLPLLVVVVGLLAPAVPAAAEPVALTVGHTDAVAPVHDGGALVMKVNDDTGTAPVMRDPSDVVFHVRAPESEIAVPDSPQLAFLGEPGSAVWLLPQVQAQDLVWPGFSSEQIPAGVLAGDGMTWRLTGVDGPGEVFVFQNGAFGAPTMSFRSDQPLPQERPMAVGVHAHYNWAFTATGRYTLTFEVAATAASGGPLTTGEVDYTFVVGGFDDLDVELSVDGMRAGYAPGDTVTLRAAQTPRTVLDHFHWFVKCPGDTDFAVVAGAHGAVHSFPARLEDDGCEYRATVYTDDHQEIATSEPVALDVAEPIFAGRTVLSTGHVDAIAPRLEDGVLTIRVKDDTDDEAVIRDAAQVVLHAKTPAAEVQVPDLDPFAFLGAPGDSAWILPQIQNPDLLWPGFSSEAIPSGALAGDQLTWTLTDLQGPGAAFLYVEDAIGMPIHRFRSDEPLPQSVSMPTGTHDHFNWAFTEPGLYRLTFTVSATAAGGGVVVSEPAEYQVLVGGYGDLRMRLAVTGAEGEHEPGDQVALVASQDPATDLDHYHWFRRCDSSGEFAVVSGAFTASHAFTAQAGDEGCQYKAAVYDHDHVKIAESEPVTLHVHPGDDGPGADPDPKPDPDPRVVPDPAPKGDPDERPSEPRQTVRPPTVLLHGASLRKRSLVVRMRISKRARATVQILRRGRIVARGKARTVRKGRHAIRFTLGRSLDPGAYRVRVRVTANGRATVKTIALRVERR
jgi:surface-anchored protein